MHEINPTLFKKFHLVKAASFRAGSSLSSEFKFEKYAPFRFRRLIPPVIRRFLPLRYLNAIFEIMPMHSPHKTRHEKYCTDYD